jgi:hypothetical protein
MLAGGIAEAEATCRSLLDRDHDPSVEGLARLCLGRAVVAQGRVADRLAELRRMRDAPAVTSGERAVAGGWASIARLALGDLDGAAATAELARDEAVAAGSHPTASVAVTALGLVKEVIGRTAQLSPMPAPSSTPSSRPAGRSPSSSRTPAAASGPA